MAAEDRDRLFENALARHLGSDAAAGDSGCLDPELLAAYHERMLSPEEINVAKEHVVSCLRCQEILSQLEATDDVQAMPNDQADFMVARAISRPNAGPAAEISSQPLAAAVALASESKIASFPARKNLLLRWATPAGAIAAGLLLWIAVREFRPPPRLAGESTQIAENRSQSSRRLDEAPAPPQPALKEKAELSRDEAFNLQQVAPAASEPHDQLRASRSAGNLADGLRADKKALSAAPPAASQVSKAPSLGGGRGQGSGSAVADAGVVLGKIAAKTDPVEVPARSQTIEVEPEQSQLAVQQSEIKQQAGGAPRPAAPPPPAPLPSKERPSTVVTSQAAVPALEMKDTNQPAALVSEGFSNLAALTSEVMAPDGKSRWRFGVGGSIVHSADSGQTWRPQASGVTATLTHGSAPSDKVCWIVGSSGTLLFSKDGGKHWKVVATPIAGDLGGVRATDAQHASIWDLPVHLSYQTSDGGATWKQSVNE